MQFVGCVDDEDEWWWQSLFYFMRQESAITMFNLLLLVDCCMSLVASQQNSNVTTVFLIETAAQIIINYAGCFKNSLSELKVCNKPCFLLSDHNQQAYSPWCSVVFQFKTAIGLDFPWLACCIQHRWLIWIGNLYTQHQCYSVCILNKQQSIHQTPVLLMWQRG